MQPAPAADTITLKQEGASDLIRPVREAGVLRAPAVPGFLEVWQGDQRLLRTASHFADIREADFTGKGTRHDLDGATAAVTRQHSREDPGWRGWLLALLGVTGVTWLLLARPARRNAGKAEPALSH